MTSKPRSPVSSSKGSRPDAAPTASRSGAPPMDVAELETIRSDPRMSSEAVPGDIHGPTEAETGMGPERRLAPGTLLAGRYQVERFIAHGGMGDVYEVTDTELRERVALKTIRPDIVDDDLAMERFRREIQLSRKVTHPNVCRVFDLFHHADGPRQKLTFLTMELLPGITLGQRLRKQGKFTQQEALPIIRQLCAGLDAAHDAGVIHRDFKGPNIILVPGPQGPRAVITDFGIAQPAREDPDEGEITRSIRAGISGTLGYMAPELFHEQPATVASDVFALGVVLYEMVTCTRPWPAVIGDLRPATVPPRETVPGLDPRWDAAIMRCLETDPARRFQRAVDIVTALDPPPAAARGTPRFVLPAAAALVALALGGSAWMVSRNAARPSRQSLAVLGFKNVSGTPNAAWMSTALSEMFTTELVSGQQLHTVQSEQVARAKADLGLADLDALTPELRAAVHNNLDADLMLLGQFAVIGPDGARQIRLDVRLQDTSTGEVVAALADNTPEADLFKMVVRMGRNLRSQLHVDEESTAAHQNPLPSNPNAARLYAEGLQRMRAFDATGARTLYEAALKEEPDHPVIHMALASVWYSLGYWEKARLEGQRAYDLSQNLPPSTAREFAARYQGITGNWERAAAIYADLLKEDPGDINRGLRLVSSQIAANQLDQAQRTLDQLRALPAPASHDARIDYEEAKLANQQGDFKRQRAAAARAVEKANKQGSRLLVASALVVQVGALNALGESTAALAAADEAYRIAQAAQDQGLMALALVTRAKVALDNGEMYGARQKFADALAVYRTIGFREGEANAVLNLGVVDERQGRISDARREYEEALAIARDIHDERIASDALINLGTLLARGTSLTEGARAFEEVAEIKRRLEDAHGEGWARYNLGTVLLSLGQLDQGQATYQQALKLMESTGNQGDVAMVRAGLGDAQFALGNPEGCRRFYDEAIALREKAGLRAALETDRLWQARCLLAMGLSEQAVTQLQGAARLLEQESLRSEQGLAESFLAQALLARGKVDAARKAAERSLALARASEGGAEQLVRALLSSAEVDAAQRRFPDGRKRLKKALVLARQSGNVELDLTTRLTLAELEQRAGKPKDARAAAKAVATDAQKYGFALLARRATALAGRP